MSSSDQQWNLYQSKASVWLCVIKKIRPIEIEILNQMPRVERVPYYLYVKNHCNFFMGPYVTLRKAKLLFRLKLFSFSSSGQNFPTFILEGLFFRIEILYFLSNWFYSPDNSWNFLPLLPLDFKPPTIN